MAIREPLTTGVPSLPIKSFLVQPLGSDTPQKATIQTWPHPAYGDLPDAAREILAENTALEGLKLTMPDGSEWYIEDVVWEEVLNLVRAHREYLDLRVVPNQDD